MKEYKIIKKSLWKKDVDFEELNKKTGDLFSLKTIDFIRNKLKPEAHDDIHPEDPVVEVGTQAAIAAAVFNGAHIVRSHNVANTCATLKIIDAVKNA